jgi:hypothetical protein
MIGDLFPLTPEEWAALRWFLWNGGLAFIAVCLITAVLEHIFGREWPFE